MGENTKLVPVSMATGGAIHVLDYFSAENLGWTPGTEGKTVCGRTKEWWVSGLVLEGDLPCQQCDKKVAVVAEMFSLDVAIRDSWSDFQTRVSSPIVNRVFDHWISFGIEAGFISEPTCDIHGYIPLTLEEEETEKCVYVVRVWPLS